MVSFDCRGLEPVDWECRGGFIAKTEKGKTFELWIQNYHNFYYRNFYCHNSAKPIFFVIFKIAYKLELKVVHLNFVNCYVKFESGRRSI